MCPGDASFCSAGCAGVAAEEYLPSAGCRTPAKTVGCMPVTGGCTAALTCRVRLRDGALFRFASGCSLEGWRNCTDEESAKVMGAASCAVGED
jgi:hypothetical protein